jgi:retinol dehydrogenase-12
MGALLSVAQQSFPPHPTWGVDDIPDLTGKVAIVTGVFINLGVYLYAKRKVLYGHRR